MDTTHVISAYFKPTYVTKNLLQYNQQVTNEFRLIHQNESKTLVETSEAESPQPYDGYAIKAASACSATFDEKNMKFNEWLAGLIDGDGCFLISKNKYASCEITVGLGDEPMLMHIKEYLGGSVKIRSGCKAVRWRLHNKKGMIHLITRVNGLIRNSKRILQLKQICELYDIPFLNPTPLYQQSAWYAGFFDAEGTITFSQKGTYQHIQLRISVSNKKKEDVHMFKERFGGNIYYDKSQNGYYIWNISSSDDINNFLKYGNSCIFRSIKYKRLLLIPDLKYHNALNAHKAEINTNLFKAWLKFKHKWDSAKA